MYQVKPMSQLEILAQATQALLAQDRAIQQLTTTTEQQSKQIATIKDTVVHRDDNWRKWVNERIGKIAKSFTDQFLAYQRAWAESYALLEDRAGCDLGTRVKNLKSRREIAGACKGKVSETCRLDAIEEDKRLKEIYTAIVKELTIKYVA
jgi:anti-repressor protein